MISSSNKKEGSQVALFNELNELEVSGMEKPIYLVNVNYFPDNNMSKHLEIRAFFHS